jgi:hypothetical protein
MPYYEFNYWPFDKEGNDNKVWDLIEFPKEWAEHDEGNLNVFPYYDNDSLSWYFVEVEEENTIAAFNKAWNIVSSKVTIPLKEDNYKITYFWSNEDGEIEVDWRMYSLPQGHEVKFNHVYQIDSSEFYVVIKETNPIIAFERAVALIESEVKEIENDK